MTFMKLSLIAAVAVSATAIPTFAAERQGAGHSGGQNVERRFNRMDTNSDGNVTLEEFTAFRRANAEGKPDAERMMNPQAVQRAFSRMDANADGNVTLDEVRAMAAQQGEQGNQAQRQNGAD